MMTFKRIFITSIALLFVFGGLAVHAQDAPPLLAYGEPADGALAGGQSVEIQFRAEAGDRPIIVMNAKGGDIDPYLELFDASGALIAEDDDGNGKFNARIDGITIERAGVYTVRLTNEAAGGSGNFSVIVNEASQILFYSGAGFGSFDVEANNDYLAYELSQPWERNNLTYALVNVLPGFSDGQVEQVIEEAFAAWTNDTPLTFERVDGNRADIVVEFAGIDGGSQVLGQACPPSSPCAGSVQFDSDEAWVLYEPQYYDDISLLGVATHEFGHAIGLLHSNDTNALMYPQYSPYNLAPSQDDIAGVQRLYGAGRGGVIGAPTPAPGGGTSDDGNEVTSTISDEQFQEFWDFDVNAGEYVTIEMEALSGGLDPLLVILDANDNVLGYDDDSAGGLDAVVRNIRFPETGTYTAVATRFQQAQGYSEGDYRLLLTFGETEASATDAATASPRTGGGSVQVTRATTEDLTAIPSLDSILDRPFVDSLTPITQTASGTVRAGDRYLWTLTWCAADDGALERSLADIAFGFTVEGVPVPSSTLARVIRQTEDGLACAYTYVMLSGWSGEAVRLRATLRLEDAVFDGLQIYQPGDYIYETTIRVTP